MKAPNTVSAPTAWTPALIIDTQPVGGIPTGRTERLAPVPTAAQAWAAAEAAARKCPEVIGFTVIEQGVCS